MTTEGEPTTNDAAARQSPPSSRRKRFITVAVWAYLFVIVAVWLWMRMRGDRGPWATIFLFGPRWLCMTPLLVLVPLAAIWQRKLLLVLALALAIALGPICGLQLNMPRPNAPYKLRIVTCNVDQTVYDPNALAELIKSLTPDIVALQECKRDPPPQVWPPGWHVQRADELLVASAYPVDRVAWMQRPAVRNKPAVVEFRIHLPRGELQLFNLHQLTPRPGLEAVLDSRRGIDLAGLPALREIIEVRDHESLAISRWVLERPGPKIVVGDFNTPVESQTFRRDWGRLSNAFTEAGSGFGFTKVTETHGWEFGARIDHVLFSPPWTCVRAWVGPDIGSDHRPLVVDLR